MPYYDNYDNSGRVDHILQSGGVKKISSRSACDGDSFKSDYMSCSSSKLSSDSDQVGNFATGNSDDAIVVYPNGTIGRLKMSKLKLLKVRFFAIHKTVKFIRKIHVIQGILIINCILG